MLVYCGKGMFTNDDPYSDHPSTKRIPEVLNKGHILYTDNYYTSPALARFLISHRTYLCGTIKFNRRNYAKELVNVDLEKGTAAFYVPDDENDKLLACKYRASRDKTGNKPKVVYMLSTYHAPTMKVVNEEHRVMKPSLIKNYNQHMGGVDRVDQQLHNLKTLRKSYKWYKKLAFSIISQVALNACKVYNFHTRKDVTF